MSSPVTIEEEKLLPVNQLLNKILPRTEGGSPSSSYRLAFVEAVSCRNSGISYDEYSKAFSLEKCPTGLTKYADEVLSELRSLDIPVPLSIAALARVTTDTLSRKKSGSYYTDYRLALYLGEQVANEYQDGKTIVDPASGTGMLLVGLLHCSAGKINDMDSVLSSSVFAADSSPEAIRGARASLASLATRLEAVKELDKHLYVRDSLTSGHDAWKKDITEGFDIVIGNPPWEKVKTSRHEYALAHGFTGSYGSLGESFEKNIETEKSETRRYASAISREYGTKGEVDLYRAFLSLSLDIRAPDGCLAMFLPAGLIRSKSNAEYRTRLVDESSKLEIVLFDNHAKFFSIDSRFKFLLVHAAGGSDLNPLDPVISYPKISSGKETSKVSMGKELFLSAGSQLGVPEVKNMPELDVLTEMQENGLPMSAADSPFKGSYMREMDMTNDRRIFQKEGGSNLLPLVEGRMVGQFRCGAKRYLSGAGRSARWELTPSTSFRLSPQFWVDKDNLSDEKAERAFTERVGFCDITGQTNERSMIASRIPSGVICGNKVPTIVFSGDEKQSEFLSSLWLGIVNSFAFDWIARRYITTTVNFFILESLPLPKIDIDSRVAMDIVKTVRDIEKLYRRSWDRQTFQLVAGKRACVDAIVLEAYGLSEREWRIVSADFPLVDKRLPPIDGKHHRATTELVSRCLLAREQGALGDYVSMPQDALAYITGEQIRFGWLRGEGCERNS